jgi:hypothetical protein
VLKYVYVYICRETERLIEQSADELQGHKQHELLRRTDRAALANEKLHRYEPDLRSFCQNFLTELSSELSLNGACISLYEAVIIRCVVALSYYVNHYEYMLLSIS